MHVSDPDGLPKSGVGVHIWNEALNFDITVITNALGEGKKRIADGQYFDVTWHIQVVEGGMPASEVKDVATSSKCCDAHGEEICLDRGSYFCKPRDKECCKEYGPKICTGQPTVWTLWFKATGR